MNRPPHDIVRAVRDELAVPGRYHLGAPAVRERSWLAIVLRWLYDRYAAFAHALSTRLHVGSHAVHVFGDAVVVAIVLLVAIVAARLLISVQMDRSARGRAVSLEPVKSAHALARKASEAAAQGHYDGATRLLFAAAVTLLDLRGIVADDASATINELRRALRGTRVEGDFSAIARAYSVIAYAEEPADEALWHAALSSYERIAGGASA